MRRWLGVVFLVLIASCATLREDPSKPAVESDFYTAEGLVQGERFRGTKIISVEKGQLLTSIDFKIQGLFSGAVKIDSNNCRLNTAVRYKDSALVPVPLNGVADKSCVVTFLVTPEYPRQRNQAVVVHGLKGALAIKVREPSDAWIGREVVLPVSGEKTLEFDLRENFPVQVFFDGCGISYSAVLAPQDGVIRIPVNDISVRSQGLCVASGIVVSQEYEDLFLDIVVARHSDDFIDLPKPVVRFDGSKICLSSDAVVSFLMSDKESSNCTSKCFSSTSLVRGVTVKGRTFVGEVKGGTVEWK